MLKRVCVVFLAFSIFSCSKDKPEKAIIGKWILVEYQSDEYEVEACDFLSTLQFNTDGTFSQYEACDKETTTGLYEVSETVLSVIPDSFPITIGLRIISLTSRSLSYEFEGDVITYEKM